MAALNCEISSRTLKEESPCAHVSFSAANGGDIVAFVTIAHFDHPMLLIRKHEEIYFSNRPHFLWVYGRNKPSWDVGGTLEKLINHSTVSFVIDFHSFCLLYKWTFLFVVIAIMFFQKGCILALACSALLMILF